MDLKNRAVTNITLSVDVYNHNTPPYVYAKQFDANSRFLNIKFTSFDKVIKINGIAQLNAKKPDGTASYITGYTNEDGTVTVGLTSGLLAAVGKVSCDVVIFDSADDKQAILTSSTFYIIVEKSHYAPDAIESTDEYSGVSTVLLQIAEERRLAETAKDEAIRAANDAKEASSKQVDNIVLTDNKLQLSSNGAPIGDPIEIPSGVKDVVFQDDLLYLIDNEENLIGKGTQLPDMPDDITTGPGGTGYIRLYLSKNGDPLGSGVSIPCSSDGNIVPVEAITNMEIYNIIEKEG